MALYTETRDCVNISANGKLDLLVQNNRAVTDLS